MKILVTGANGQLGKCLQDAAPAYGDYRFIFLGREHFALEQFAMVQQVMHTLRPDVVINAAAYTAVDKAETQETLAFLMNAEVVGHLARQCGTVGSRLLHVSTDYVFDGQSQTPYQETDPVHPLGVYGASKQKGEQLALENHSQTAVVRTSWVYSRHGHNFVKTMLRLMGERPEIKVVNDQWGNPTWAMDLAHVLIQMAGASHFTPGIFHYTNSGPITWHRLATQIAATTGKTTQVHPITTAEYPTPARRPAYSSLNCQKIAQVYGIAQKNWEHSLELCLQEMTNQE
ncbi:MAG TPA: dTDP-4-dehydrorhamnose reductase [Phnomibacter sp.]|nr:dTDP-4-dehydrorhamnose reductase [Phnomibacter sp.]